MALMREHSTEFKDDFTHNKEAVGRLLELHSKKMRNIIAGYVTRMKKKGEE